jgi:hypothetical protein
MADLKDSPTTEVKVAATVMPLENCKLFIQLGAWANAPVDPKLIESVRLATEINKAAQAAAATKQLEEMFSTAVIQYKNYLEGDFRSLLGPLSGLAGWSETAADEEKISARIAQLKKDAVAARRKEREAKKDAPGAKKLAEEELAKLTTFAHGRYKAKQQRSCQYCEYMQDPFELLRAWPICPEEQALVDKRIAEIEAMGASMRNERVPEESTME